MSGTALLAMYRGLWRATMPLVRWYVRRKDLRRMVPRAITAERFGYSKPPGRWRKDKCDVDYDSDCFTLWIHGASVGECLSALPLVELALTGRFDAAVGSQTHGKYREVRVVLSTTTTAARQLLSERLESSDRAVCVLAPLDNPECVERFYDAWQPDAGLWLESELWPTLIAEASRRGIRVGLINGRLSPQSFWLWRLPGLHRLCRSVVSSFSLVLCQDEQNRKQFELLGARNAQCAPNLKFASKRLTTSETELNALQDAIGSRPAWVAASTHEGEEEMMAVAHVELLQRLNSDQPLLTVLIPRHPTRTPAILEQLSRQFPELTITLRSRDHLPKSTDSLFIVDTLGETNLFFDTIGTVVIGGTFVNRGGHNPIEPLRAGCQVLVGPNMQNFTDILQQLEAHLPTPGVLQTVDTPNGIAAALQTCFEGGCGDRDGLETTVAKTASSARGNNSELTQVMQTLAVSTLSVHKQQLIRWLAEDKPQVKAQ